MMWCVGLYLGICTALRIGQGGVFHPIPGHRWYYSDNNLSRLRFDIQGDSGELAARILMQRVWTTSRCSSHRDHHRATWLDYLKRFIPRRDLPGCCRAPRSKLWGSSVNQQFTQVVSVNNLRE